MSSPSNETVNCKTIEVENSSTAQAQGPCQRRTLPRRDTCSLHSLPNELILEITEYLDMVGLVALTRVSRRLYDMFIEEVLGKSNEFLGVFMFFVCTQGNLEGIKAAVAHGASLDEIDTGNDDGIVETIKIAVLNSVSIRQARIINNRPARYYLNRRWATYSPLEIVPDDHPEVIMFLIKSGAKIDSAGHIQKLESLVECKEGYEFLVSALKYGSTELKNLIAGFSIIKTMAESVVPPIQLIKHIVDNGPVIDPDPIVAGGDRYPWRDPLGMALLSGSIPLYKVLVDIGLHPNACNVSGFYNSGPISLFVAIDNLLETGDMEMLDTVIQSGANVNIWSRDHRPGSHALRHAKWNGMVALTPVSYYLLSLSSIAKWNTKPTPLEMLQYFAYYGGNLNPHERGRGVGWGYDFRIRTTDKTWLVDMLKWRWGKKLCLNRNFIDVMRYLSVNGRVGDHLVKYLRWAGHEKQRAKKASRQMKQKVNDHKHR